MNHVTLAALPFFPSPQKQCALLVCWVSSWPDFVIKSLSTLSLPHFAGYRHTDCILGCKYFLALFPIFNGLKVHPEVEPEKLELAGLEEQFKMLIFYL